MKITKLPLRAARRAARIGFGLSLLSLGCSSSPADDATPTDVGGMASGGSSANPMAGSSAITTAGSATTTAGSGGATTGGSAEGGAAGGGGVAIAGRGGVGGGGADGGSASGGSAGAAGASQVTPAVTPCANSELAKCSGNPLACHFGGDPGNYEVTVELGGPGETEVEAEYYRRMLTQTTVANDAKWFSFVTNVRVYEGEPLRPDQDGTTSKGIPGLDVYFRGSSPKPLSICYQPMAKPVMVWIEGDSTVTDQESTAYSGWGQHLPQHFVSPISVANYADSGESSGSVLNSPKLWGTIKAGMKTGDFVLLQVGHNDKTTPAATFRANLLKMVNDTKAAHAQMILVTPISRASGSLETQHVNSVGANLPQIIRDLGKSEGVPVIDLTVTTYAWLQTIKWQDYFANGTDQTHTNPAGADIISGFVRDAVKAQVPELAKYLR